MLDGYPQPYTIGTLLADGRWTGNMAIHWRKVGAITVEGRPLRDEPYRTRTPAPTDYRLSKKFGELLAVARVLAFYEWSGDLQPSERPDVIATTRVDGRVGVEVVEITDTAPHSAVLDELRLEVDRRLAARGIVPRAGYWLWFDPETAKHNGVGLGYEASDSARFLPRGRDRERVLDEIISFAASDAPGRIERVDASEYPTLARYGVRYAKQTLSADETARGRGFVRIGEGTVAYDPSTLLPTAERILAQKRETACTYDWKGPLWLVLHITDRRGEFFETAQTVAEAGPGIEPFEQMHILYQELLMTTHSAFGGWTQIFVKSSRLRGHRGRRYEQLE
jgi:hypothetical protein